MSKSRILAAAAAVVAAAVLAPLAALGPIGATMAQKAPSSADSQVAVVAGVRWSAPPQFGVRWS